MRRFDLTIEELLQREDDWWEREDESNLEWIQEGIKLFQLFIKKDPQNLRYSEMLSYLLLKQGEDLKFQQQSYEKAVHSFKRVAKIDPSNGIAYYRLGFLYFFEESWAKSIHAFQQSLITEPDFSRYRLNKEQRMKAHYYILKSSHFITNHTIQQLKEIPEYELELFGEIKLLLTELKRDLLTEHNDK